MSTLVMVMVLSVGQAEVRLAEAIKVQTNATIKAVEARLNYTTADLAAKKKQEVRGRGKSPQSKAINLKRNIEEKASQIKGLEGDIMYNSARLKRLKAGDEVIMPRFDRRPLKLGDIGYAATVSETETMKCDQVVSATSFIVSRTWTEAFERGGIPAHAPPHLQSNGPEKREYFLLSGVDTKGFVDDSWVKIPYTLIEVTGTYTYTTKGKERTILKAEPMIDFD